MVNVYIPTPFRSFVGNRSSVDVEAHNVAEALASIDARFPGFRNLCYNAEGAIPPHINVYVNNQEITSLDGEATTLAEGDQIAVIPALAGGAPDNGDGSASGGNPQTPAEGRNGSSSPEDPSNYALTPERVTRYSRHLIMPQVGSVGQRKIFDTKVLIIGAGGLGSPVALYLALAGVGTIGIVDFDVVDLSNLQRQILHQNDDVGKRKVVSAQETLNAYNPDVKVITHEEPLHSENALGIIDQYDLVVNGADNFAARYLANDACVFLKKPLVDGSILMFDGQATVYLPGEGCYRCLYPTPPPPGMVPSCAEAGVLGAMCATIGSIQATEVLKLILGIGESLQGRLVLYDALTMEMRQVRVRRDPNCVVCGDNPTVTELIDYDEFCGTAPAWTE
jgi:molybdopterin/thiamine biosynthesis adenylyltransferase/molybdopterin converting factor small subunit